MKDSQNLKKKIKKFIKKTAKPVEAMPQKKTEEKISLMERFQNVQKKTRTRFKKFLKSFQTINFKNIGSNLLLLLIPLTLFFILLSLHTLNERLTDEMTKNQLAPFPSETELNPYPIITTIDQNVPLVSITAKSAIITDYDSQVILFTKNPELRFSMASTTKIMTALVALEYFKSNSILTIKTLHVDGTTLGFIPGEQFYFKDLLYAMLLPSANDAAVAIADNYPGGETAFVAKMNAEAKTLHLSNTHFSDPDGLNDDGDYTTALDMARLASVAIKNKTFAEAASTKEKVITSLSHLQQYPLSNLNKLLGIDGVTGIKTGTTEGAGEVLVTSTVINGHTFIIVVMNSEDRFGDTSTLLNFISQNIQFINPEGMSQQQ